MLRKEKEERNQVGFVSLESLVPSDHILRKIDAAVDFTHIYDFVEDLYCSDNGRPSIDSEESECDICLYQLRRGCLPE